MRRSKTQEAKAGELDDLQRSASKSEKVRPSCTNGRASHREQKD